MAFISLIQLVSTILDRPISVGIVLEGKNQMLASWKVHVLGKVGRKAAALRHRLPPKLRHIRTDYKD